MDILTEQPLQDRGIALLKSSKYFEAIPIFMDMLSTAEIDKDKVLINLR
jgi:hypothetical protein